MKNKKMIPMSLLIPTMNRPETLFDTLKSYFSSNCIPKQIIIVDQSENAREINDNKKVIDYFNKFNNIEYYYLSIPSSTQARNLAIEHTKYEIVIFSDDDINIFPNTLENIESIFKRKNISMVAGIDINSECSNSNIGYFFGTKSYRKRNIGHVTLSMLSRYPDNITDEIETEWAMGYFFVVRHSILKNNKLQFDENLKSYAYAEDLDFSYRYYCISKNNGFKCILTPKVKVRHMVSKEYRVPSDKSTYMYILHRAYLINKMKFGLKGFLAYNWTNFWRLIERIIRHENASCFIRAIIYYKKNKKEVFEGKFYYGE